MISEEKLVISQARGMRQLASGQVTMEGDILIRDRSPETSTDLGHAPLSDPHRLWASGTVEYSFYRTFVNPNKQIVLDAMSYITSKVPCINFQPKIPSTKDYVEIYPGGVSCSSEYGRIGGKQDINLNRYISNTCIHACQ